MKSSFLYCVLSIGLAFSLVKACAVEFTTHPSSVDAAIGGSVSFSCAASGGTFDGWVFNGQSVSDGGDYSISHSPSTSTLSIGSFGSHLGGEYRCRFVCDSGISLSLPASVKFFGNVAFSNDPEDFQSYQLNDPANVSISIADNVKERETIAFQCTLVQSDDAVAPVISWQRCEDNETFSDVPTTSPTFGLTDQRSGLEEFIQFQSGSTGYLQILEGENPVFANARYRCRAASSVAGDAAAPVFSQCAAVVWHGPDVPVPSNFPVFRTVPLREINILETEIGFMACSLQNNPQSQKFIIRNSQSDTIASTLILVDPPPGGFLKGETNLEIDGSLVLSDDPSFTSATFECNIATTNLSHYTTFTLTKPYQAVASTVTTLVAEEGDQVVLSLDLDSPPAYVKLFRNGAQVSFDGVDVVYGVSGTSNSVQLMSVGRDDGGCLQLEAANRASTVVKYFSLTIMIPPVTSTDDDDVDATVGGSENLVCNVTSNTNETTVAVTWKRDDQVIARENITLTDGEGSASLPLANLSIGDSGVYECSFENRLGMGNTAAFTVDVQTFPPPVITSTAVEMVANGTAVNVTFEPPASGNPDGFVVQIEYMSPDGQVITMIVMLGANETSTSFLIPDSATGIRVRVKSARGGQDISDYSEWTEVGSDSGYYSDRWWVIFLTVLFSVIGCCALLLWVFLCLCLALCLAPRARKSTTAGDHNDDDDDERKSSPSSRSDSPASISGTSV